MATARRGPRPLTANEQLLDAMVRHQIGLLRFAGHLRNETWRLLDATEADLREQVQRILRRSAGTITPADLRRIQRVIEVLRETRAEAWSEIDRLWVSELRGLVLAEPSIAAGIVRTVAPVRLDLKVPPPEQLRAIITTHPFEGRVMKDWASQIRAADVGRMEQQIRIGMVQGEDLPSISRRVVGTVRLRGTNGVTEITRREAAGIVRTAVNSYANEARRQFALENDDVVDRELFVATLDSRTTPVCRARDGDVYEIGEGPTPPLHWLCRSLRVMLLDPEAIGVRPFKASTERMLVEEFAQNRRLPGNLRRRVDLPRGTKKAFDEFARRRVRELTGQVPAKVNYDQWLRRQSQDFQRDVLGATRARLYRDGGMSLDRFVDRVGKEIPLRDLARFEADAFRAAGLDPEDFL